MKRKLTIIGIFSAFIFLLFFAACPQETESKSNEEKPKTSFGKELNLSGRVYTVELQADTFNFGFDYKPFPGTKNLTVTAAGIDGTGEVKNGNLGFTAGEPAPALLVPLTGFSDLISGGLSDFIEGDIDASIYKNMQITPSDAAGTVLALQITGDDDYNTLAGTNLTTLPFNMSTFSITMIMETVNYIYVDRDVTVKAEGESTDLTALVNLIDLSDISPVPIENVTMVTSNIKMDLKTGWNTMYVRTTVKLSFSEEDFAATVTAKVDVSAANPSSLKWTLDSFN